MKNKIKRPLKGAQLATAVGDAYHDGYVDGLKEQAEQLHEAEIIIKWIYSTVHEERIDFIIDREIKDYFTIKEAKTQ